MDKHGKKEMNSQGLTGIEQYMGLTNGTREQLVCLNIRCKFL